MAAMIILWQRSIIIADYSNYLIAELFGGSSRKPPLTVGQRAGSQPDTHIRTEELQS